MLLLSHASIALRSLRRCRCQRRRQGLADVQPRRPGTRHNRARRPSTVQRRPARREVAIPRQGLRAGDRRHPRHARRRGRLRLLRHGHRPDVLQADARRQGPLVLPQPGSTPAAGRPKQLRRRCQVRWRAPPTVDATGASSARRSSPATPSSSATWTAGSTRWTGRPGRSGGSSTRAARSSPAPIP